VFSGWFDVIDVIRRYDVTCCQVNSAKRLSCQMALGGSAPFAGISTTIGVAALLVDD
jgi:hypothetical protein